MDSGLVVITAIFAVIGGVGAALNGRQLREIRKSIETLKSDGSGDTQDSE